ncbi:MAG: addiction module toxin RelE, partial [Colwellia sp.]|nr:addiction module toxin RelE [Colwellia sp.]
SKQQALLLFCAYIDEPSDDIWSNVKNQVFLGSAAFVQIYTESLESSKLTAEIPNSQVRRSAEPLANYQDKYANRNEAICQAYLTGAYTLARLAEHFSLHYSTISRIIAKNKT